MSKTKQLLEDLKSVVKEARLMGCKEVRTFSNVPIENIDIIIAALEEQLSNRWISCSKRLPDNEPSYIIGTTYYITTSNGTVRIAKYKERKWIESFGRTIAYNDVVAWKKRIIPEPYKEGEE